MSLHVESSRWTHISTSGISSSRISIRCPSYDGVIMREKLRFGIVGLGSIAKTHAEVISSLDNAELVSAFHKNKEKADSFASSYGAKGYSDLDSFLSSGIDVLTVTTPSAVRCEYALPAMERGISVLLEKPMDVSPDKAKLMIETAERCGITLGVIFQNRFSPLNKEIRKASKGNGRIDIRQGRRKRYRMSLRRHCLKSEQLK